VKFQGQIKDFSKWSGSGTWGYRINGACFQTVAIWEILGTSGPPFGDQNDSGFPTEARVKNTFPK